MGRKLLEAEEREREKRVAHLQQLALRRLSQLSLARGWNAWAGKHEERQRQARLLRAAAVATVVCVCARVHACVCVCVCGWRLLMLWW